uniref:Heat shock protein 70 n=1 Tax=Panagrolaimus sp. ES5 TaxID=591445 RepID=A0AC34F1M3_9BILA
MKFDDLQNYISAFDIYEKVDLEVKNREYHFEAVIKHGEEVAKLYNNEDINKYINEIINQRNGLKETLENHSPTFIEARNIIECCAKVDKIEESLRNKFKMEEKFEASILQTKQFLNVLESHLVNIVAVDEEKDKIKERILSSGTAPKVLVFLNELKIRSKNIHARCFKLCDNVKKQLLLLEKRENEEKTTSPPSDPFPIKPVNTNITSYLFPQKVSNYDNKINAVGIDLGTSRCCMAVSRNNKMETVALENAGERPLPSFVSFDEEDIKCGDVVLKGFLKYKEKYTVFDVKRFIGKEFHDIVPDRSWPFQVVEENDKVMIKTEDVHGEILKKPEEISAILLKYMKEKAKEFQGKPETKAVLTVPAAFTDSQKKSTLEAARLAGWENITLLPEPIAASFAYFNNREIPNNSNALLFDFGGGTLDVCLFKIVDQKIEIISNIGDTCLGGRDIDNLLIRYFTNALRFKYNINVNERVRRKYQLMLECQAIKHNLTLTKKDLLNVETFDSNINGIIEIERIELEELMTELLQRMKTAINQTLNNAKLSPKDIHKVLQVGGGCRMPVVKEMLKNMFKNADHCCEQQPDEVVAVGAAIYAYHLATIDV